MQQISDDDLVERYRRGSVDAFEQLYRRHAAGLFTYLRMQVGEAAEDLLQETFSRVSRGLARYQPDGRFGAWIFSIARNLVRDHMRRPRREVALEEASDGGGLDDWQVTRVAVRAALRALPPEQLEVVLLREYGGLTFPEIGRIVGCPPNTAITRMHRALERMRRVLAEAPTEV